MTERSASVLGLAVRGRVVVKYLGQLLLSLAVMAAVPAVVAVWFGEVGLAWRCFVLVGAFVVVGGLCARLRAPNDIQVNEALTITSLLFVVAALAMAWSFAALAIAPVDALFEAVSAVSTTGLTTLEHLEDRSPAFLFARAWLQWYGGLAIVVLVLAYVLRPGPALRRLGAEEFAEDVVGGTKARARAVLLVYVCLTIVGVLVLLLAGLPVWSAVLHVLTSVSTGGFAPHDASIAALDGTIARVAVVALSVGGAISFSVLYQSARSGQPALYRDPQLRAFLWLVLGISVALFVAMTSLDGRGWRDAGEHAPLLAISAQTTAGFASTLVEELGPAGKAVLIVAMFIGGDSGSTAGGVKIFRFLLLLALMRQLIVATCLPSHAVVRLQAGGRTISEAELRVAVTIVLLYLVAIGLSWLAFLAYAQPPLDALFDVVSAFGTVGLSAGVTSPDLPAVLKLVLCVDMLMGRLEVVAVIVLLYPRNWIGRRYRQT